MEHSPPAALAINANVDIDTTSTLSYEQGGNIIGNVRNAGKML